MDNRSLSHLRLSRGLRYKNKIKMKLFLLTALVASAAAFSLNQQKIDLGKGASGAAFAVAVAFGVAVSPAVAGDVVAGEQIFQPNCAACHAGGENVIMREKTLKKEALDQFLTGGRNEISVMTLVTNGKNAMPAFGRRLSQEDIANVATYVITTSEAGWN